MELLTFLELPNNLPNNTATLAKRSLRNNSHLATKHIACEVLDGVLVLRGRVQTYYLKQIAQQVASKVNGVRHVDNQIEVVSPVAYLRQD